MINPTWLKTFCTLVDIGHFTQTAEILFMTQSGVSQHIQKLERQLDTLLLIREGKTFSLTEAGVKLHSEGKYLLNSLIELETSVKLDEPYSGSITIASPGSIGLKLYPYLLDIQQQYPNLIINYSFAPNSDIEEKIADKIIDIGLLTQHSKTQNVSCKKIAVEPLVLVTPKGTKSINWQKLLSLGFISHPDAKHQAQLLLSHNFSEFEHIAQFNQKGFSNQISLILEPVSRGIGFTVLPLHAVMAFYKQSHIQVHQLENPVEESLYLCHNQQSYETKRKTYLKSLINSFMKE